MAQNSTHEWVLLKADKDIGEWRTNGSPNTDEDYIITVAGSWVPAVDVDWLLSFKKRCSCNKERLIQMFARVVPTEDQLTKKPARSPRYKANSPNFGLSRIN